MNQLAWNRNLRPVPRTCSAVRRAVLVFAALVAVLLPALPLRADQDVQDSQQVYCGSGFLVSVSGTSELTLRNTPGAAQGLYPTSRVFAGNYCSGKTYGKPSPPFLHSMPAGWLTIYQSLYFYNGSAWVVCNNQGWSYSSAELTSLTVVGNGSVIGTKPCGAGYYGLNSGVFAWDQHAWRGGWVWSGVLNSQ